MQEHYNLGPIDPLYLKYLGVESERTGHTQIEVVEFAIAALANLRHSTLSGAIIIAREPGSDDTVMHFRTRAATVDDQWEHVIPNGSAGLMRPPAEWRADGVIQLRPRPAP